MLHSNLAWQKQFVASRVLFGLKGTLFFGGNIRHGAFFVFVQRHYPSVWRPFRSGHRMQTDLQGTRHDRHFLFLCGSMGLHPCRAACADAFCVESFKAALARPGRFSAAAPPGLGRRLRGCNVATAGARLSKARAPRHMTY